MNSTQNILNFFSSPDSFRTFSIDKKILTIKASANYEKSNYLYIIPLFNFNPQLLIIFLVSLNIFLSLEITLHPFGASTVNKFPVISSSTCENVLSDQMSLPKYTVSMPHVRCPSQARFTRKSCRVAPSFNFQYFPPPK